MKKLYLLLAGAMTILAACASMDATVNTYSTTPELPPTDPAKVVILKIAPTRDYIRLGQVAIDSTYSPAPSPESLQERMRKEAAKIGADAVIIVYDDAPPASAYSISADVKTKVAESANPRRRTIGVAIKYR
ncbi:hypothetical protein ACDA63_05825 [Uliginosibacterium sp. sgz301328]|uniref:hypothetical protein n=1 Tax=Uliginosibacterium sp. sgz301328 TaxID=3243764 RepID=UPI00359E4CCC